MPHVEVLVSREPRRRWTVDQKRAIVAESYRPGSTPMATARKHGISSGQMSTWRGQFGRPAALAFARVEMTRELTPREMPGRVTGLLEIVLPDGMIVRADAGVSDKFLGRVLKVLRER